METLIKNSSTKQVIEQAESTLAEAGKLLKDRGVEYDLGEWVTIKNYCKRFGIKTEAVVVNWISRGIVPPENIHVVEELNGLRLIKAVPYKE